MLPSPSFDDIRTGHDDTILAGYGRYQRYHCPALTTSFLLIRSAGKTCETNRFGPMKFHYCDKVGYRLSLVVVRRTGQAKTHASKRNPHHSPRSVTGFPLFWYPPHFCSFFNNLETPDTVPSNMEEIVIQRKGQRDVMCHPKHNPENHEQGWCHTKVGCFKL